MRDKRHLECIDSVVRKILALDAASPQQVFLQTYSAGFKRVTEVGDDDAMGKEVDNGDVMFDEDQDGEEDVGDKINIAS